MPLHMMKRYLAMLVAVALFGIGIFAGVQVKVPATAEEYNRYRENCLQFIESRNHRIDLFYNK